MFTNSGTGAARRALELHRRMPNELEFVAFVTSGFSNEWREELPGFRFVEVGDSRSLASRLREGSGSFWRKLLRENDCGVWVTDTLPVPRIPKIRTCLTVHDLRFLESRKFVSIPRYILLRSSMDRSLKMADAVVAVSDWTGKIIREHYGTSDEKLSVIGNAVDGQELRKAATEVPGLVKFPYLLSVGHLETRKNFETLVEAFALIKNDWDGVLVIVGRDQGSRSSIVASAAKLGVSDRLVLKSGLSYPELARLYMDSSVVVCPSRYEGFGITLLEGMSAGKPVVASDIPPHREVAGDAALYSDPDSPDGFAGAIRSVLDDKGLSRTMVSRGEKRLELFSWDESAKKLEALYRKLLGG